MSRFQFANKQVIVDGAMENTDEIVSEPTNVEHLQNVGYQANWDGDPVGTFTVEVSNDYDPTIPARQPGTWTELTLSGSPAAAGAPGDLFININQIPARWIRLKYVNDSGSGTLQAWVVGKSI